MRHQLAVALFVLTCLSAPPARAAQHHLGVDGVFSLLRLDVGGGVDSKTFFGIGALFRYEFLGVSPQLTITARLGYIFGLSKEVVPGVDVSLSSLPLLGGVKYYFRSSRGDLREGLYVGGELGIFYNKSKISGGFGGDSETDLGLTGGIGYEVSSFDLSARFFTPDIGDFSDAFGLWLTVGYSFHAF